MAATYDKTFICDPLPPKPKRIVVCCDGTWQSAVSIDPKKGCPSNVARLSRVLAKAGTGLVQKNENENEKELQEWQQVVYYDAGVGTGGISWLETIRQGSKGLGLLENVIEAYNFIVNNYSKGDQLFFFGFSRGAYTARSAAGLVQQFGVMKPASMRSFLKHYGEYIKKEDFSEQFIASNHWKQFLEEEPNYAQIEPQDVKIQVIGVWDTVGALGVPDLGHWWKWDNSKYRKAYQFHKTDLSKQVLHAYQALALDERRSAFSPTLWHLEDDNDKTKLVQCWFPGAHINVGGGSTANADKENARGDREQLSSIAYLWMLDRIRPHLAFDNDALETQKAEIEKAAKPIEPKPKGKQGWYEWSKELVWGAPAAVQHSFGLGQVDDSHTWEYDLMGLPKDRTPRRYFEKEEEELRKEELKKKKEDQKPYVSIYTGERVHTSVHHRQAYHIELHKTDEKHKIYEPHAMRGWERVRDPNGKGKNNTSRQGWKWVKYETDANHKKVLDDSGKPKVLNSMWEFEIGKIMHNGKDESLEKWLIDISWQKEIQAKTQDGWKPL